MNDRTPATRARPSLVRVIFAFCSAWPWLNLAQLYLFALAVRIGFGKWPASQADGVDLPVVHMALPLVMMFNELSLTGLPLIWATAFVIVVFSRQTERIMAPTALFMAGVLATWIIGRIDPWHFQQWLLH
jgi:hypothetical protein